MKKTLTIAIPTYNRIEHLIKNIPFLLDQLTDECELIIVDNCSDEDVETKIQNIIKKYSRIKFNIIRNSTNIGLFGNILKCFEEANSKWLYIMGDDDRLLPNSVLLLLNDIKNNSDTINISYQWHPEKRWNNTRPMITHGCADYFSSIEAIHHIMFLASNIYNVEVLRYYIHIGHYFQSSSAPHLVMLFMALDQNKNSKVYLSNNYLVDNFNLEIEDEKKWNRLDFFRNNKLLLDLPINDINNKKLFLLYKRSYPITTYLNFFLNIENKNKIDLIVEFKKATYYHLIYGTFKDKLLIIIASYLLKYPKTTMKILKFR